MEPEIDSDSEWMQEYSENMPELYEKIDYYLGNRFHMNYFASFFYKLPAVVQQDPVVLAKCTEAVFRDMPVDENVDDLKDYLPDAVWNSEVFTRLRNEHAGTGRWSTKYRDLMRAIPRLLGAGIFFGGAVESLAFFAARYIGPRTVNAQWSSGTDGAWHFQPVPGCEMPPPQPIWVVACFDVVKIMFFTVAFGYVNRQLANTEDEQASRFDRAKFVAASTFQLVIVPTVMVMNIWSFVTEVAPNVPHAWGLYECFYIRWNSSFLDFSYWLLALRYTCTYEVVNMQTFETHCRSFWPHESLGEVLLTGCPKGELAQHKIHIIFWACASNFVFYVAVGLPFAVTHKVPGAILFSPIIFLLAVFAIGGQKVTFPEMQLPGLSVLVNNGPVSNFDTFLDKFPLRLFDQAERTGFILCLPVLFGMSVANLVLTYASVYFHEGLGWLPSVTLVLAERNADRYGAGIVSKVLADYWSFTSLVDEAL